LIWTLDEVPLAGPMLPLCSAHAVPASTSLGIASPSLLIDLLSRVSALSLLVSHPDSRLLKLTLSHPLLYLCVALRGPASTFVSGLSDHSSPLSADDSPTQNISPNAIPAPQLQEISSIRTSS